MKSLCFKYDRSGIELLKKGLYSPIININGFKAGYTGSGTKTVLPRKATAKIDIRFGPNLEPEQVVEYLKTHFADQGYADIEIIVRDAYTWAKTAAVQNFTIQSCRKQNLEMVFRILHERRSPGLSSFIVWEKTAPLCERDSCKRNQKSTDVFWATISGVEHSAAAPDNGETFFQRR